MAIAPSSSGLSQPTPRCPENKTTNPSRPRDVSISHCSACFFIDLNSSSLCSLLLVLSRQLHLPEVPLAQAATLWKLVKGQATAVSRHIMLSGEKAGFQPPCPTSGGASLGRVQPVKTRSHMYLLAAPNSLPNVQVPVKPLSLWKLYGEGEPSLNNDHISINFIEYFAKHVYLTGRD